MIWSGLFLLLTYSGTGGPADMRRTCGTRIAGTYRRTRRDGKVRELNRCISMMRSKNCVFGDISIADDGFFSFAIWVSAYVGDLRGILLDHFSVSW